jgi:hypothetical protein
MLNRIAAGQGSLQADEKRFHGDALRNRITSAPSTFGGRELRRAS